MARPACLLAVGFVYLSTRSMVGFTSYLRSAGLDPPGGVFAPPGRINDFVLNRITFCRTYRTRNLVARGTYMPGLPDLLQDLSQVVRLGTLQRRKLDIRLEFLQPQDLTDGQQVPVINISRNR